MVGQDRIVGRMNKKHLQKFVAGIAMFVGAVVLAFLSSFRIFDITIIPYITSFSIVVIAATVAANYIEKSVYIITHSPMEDEKIIPSRGYMVSYLMAVIAATGAARSWWLLIISIVMLVWLSSRIVWLVTRREDAAEMISNE